MSSIPKIPKIPVLQPGQQNLYIKLTDEQRAQIITFINETGEASLDIGIIFEADIDRKAVAPSTIMVGNAM